MLPCAPVTDVLNDADRHIQAGCYVTDFHALLTERFDLLGCDLSNLRGGVLCSARDAIWSQSKSVAISDGCASFLVHVRDVVGLRAEKQMIRSHAAWGVAVMQDEQCFVEWPEMESVRNTRCEQCAPVFATSADTPVSMLIDRPHPQPTAVGSGYLAPESFRYGFRAMAVKALTGGRDSVVLHSEPPTRCAMPPAGSNGAGALSCLDYSRFREHSRD